jgi:hypothetical protein
MICVSNYIVHESKVGDIGLMIEQGDATTSKA